MGFDEVSIGGITLFLFIVGVVEAAKKFGVTGNASFALSIVLGTVLFGLFQSNEAGLIAAEIWVWIEIAVYGLGGGLAASGLYDWAKRLRSK